jgi:hypothetical protein
VARSRASGDTADSERSRWKPGPVKTGRQCAGSHGPTSPTTPARATAPWVNSAGKPASDAPSTSSPSAVTATLRQESGRTSHAVAVVTCGRPGVPSTTEPSSARAAGTESMRTSRWRAWAMV